jgi:hypothetical protein
MADQPFRLIFEAEWNDIVCADYPLTAEQWIGECIRPLAGTQVDCLLYNLCSSDAFCCGLENGEILCDSFDQIENAWVWRYRENTRKLIEADANPPKLACEYGHRLGLKVIPIVRMNDPHDQAFKYEVSQFKKDNPHLLLGCTGPDWEPPWGTWFRSQPDPAGMDATNWGLFDFAHQEVRDHKMAVIEEFITRWDNDGIALDFDRDPRYFKEAGSSENAAVMTQMLRDVRRILDRTARERGRPMFLHVRVIGEIDAGWQRGLDVRTWVNEGLVDAVSPGAGYMTFDLDLAPWLEMVEGHDCWIYPSNNHWKTTEITRAWAKLMYRRGAHGVQLFNFGHMLYGHDRHTQPVSEREGTVWYEDLHPDYYRVLHEAHCPDMLALRDCAYDLDREPREPNHGSHSGQNHRNYRGIDAIVLPVTLTVGSHTVPFGFADDLEAATRLGFSVRISLRMKIFNYTQPDEFCFSINGHPIPSESLTARAQFIMDDFTSFSCALPGKWLKLDRNELVIDVKKLNPQVSGVRRLENVRIDVKYV